MSRNTKKYISFFTTLLHMCGNRIVFPMGAYSTYIISYYSYNYEKGINIFYSFLLSPLLTSFMTFTIPISGILERCIGFRCTIALSSLVTILTSVLVIFCKNFYLLFFCYIFFGVGMGLSSFLSTKNTCYYFPTKRGLITALVVMLSGLGVAGFNIIGEHLINPNNVSSGQSEYYPEDVAKNYPRYLYFIMIVSPTINLIYLFLLCIFNTDKYQKDSPELDAQALGSENNQKVIDEKIVPLFPNEKTETADDVAKEESNLSLTITSSYKEDMKQVFFSGRFLKLLCICSFFSFLPLMIMNTYRPIGLATGKNQEMLKITQSITSIVMGCITPLWGFLYDKLGFRAIFLFLSVYGILIGVLFITFFDKGIQYMVIVVLNGLMIGGVQAVVMPHVMKVFGMKYAIEIGGILGFSVGLTSIIGSVYSFFILKDGYIDSFSKYIGYGLGIFLLLIAFLLSVFEDDLKFKYDSKEKKRAENKEKILSSVQNN